MGETLSPSVLSVLRRGRRLHLNMGPAFIWISGREEETDCKLVPSSIPAFLCRVLSDR